MINKASAFAGFPALSAAWRVSQLRFLPLSLPLITRVFLLSSVLVAINNGFAPHLVGVVFLSSKEAQRFAAGYRLLEAHFCLFVFFFLLHNRC